MRITTRGRYALRASLALAKLGVQGVPVSINTLSAAENVSSVFLEQIFFRLKKAGIVISTRGPGGGFYFAQPPHELTVRQILEAAGEDLDMTFCDKSTDDCERIGECLSHQVWAAANELVKNYFADITLSSILEQYDRNTNPEAGKHG
jgi:Rrf2 family iron-sulfur cluster assembly transcriptional regulator